MGEYITQALEAKREKTERTQAAAAARAARTERRASGEGQLATVEEQPPGVDRLSSSEGASPMSTTMEAPEAGGAVMQLPEAEGTRTANRSAIDADSSDEEGAHRPPSPPSEPPAVEQPLAPPPIELASQMQGFAAKLLPTTPVTDELQSKTRPRTTRVSDTKPRGRRQSFVDYANREVQRRARGRLPSCSTRRR
eukprot:3300521-Prymnesium_polylepis.2